MDRTIAKSPGNPPEAKCAPLRDVRRSLPAPDQPQAAYTHRRTPAATGANLRTTHETGFSSVRPIDPQGTHADQPTNPERAPSRYATDGRIRRTQRRPRAESVNHASRRCTATERQRSHLSTKSSNSSGTSSRAPSWSSWPHLTQYPRGTPCVTIGCLRSHLGHRSSSRVR